MIIPASEVHEAVDEVETQFLIQGMAMRRPFAGGGVGTDDDLAVMEGDDIRGSGVVKEVGVDLGDGGVAHDGRFDLGQMQQGGIVVFNVLKHEWNGLLQRLEQPDQIAVLRCAALVKTGPRDAHADQAAGVDEGLD